MTTVPALSLSGRLRAMVATWSATSYSISAKSMRGDGTVTPG